MRNKAIPKQNVFAVSDIHGHADELKLLLQSNKENNLIIFCGDYIDRGRQSKDVLEHIRFLVECNKAIALKGNHEEMLLDFLNHPVLAKEYMFTYGLMTIHSLLGFYPNEYTDPKNVVAQIECYYPWLKDFLQKLYVYVEMDNYLFVHAGINPDLDKWYESSEDDYLWIREDFYMKGNKTNKIIIFGHTPTEQLPNGSPTEIWKRKDGLIGIDGGMGHNQQLNGISISKNDTMKQFYVKH